MHRIGRLHFKAQVGRSALPRMDLLVVVRTVLDAAIRVMEQLLLCLSSFQCHLQCLSYLLCLQRFMHVPDHDLA